MRLGQSQTPPGMRIYAIGDVHGCDAMLAEVHERIAADLAANPPADHRVIHVCDYADRGPNSAGVVARLAKLTAESDRAICLRGNHDQMLIDFLLAPESGGPLFFDNGGDATLSSYGIAGATGGGYAQLARELATRMPPADLAFIHALPLTARFGDYLFVHAGIRPGVPIEAQDPQDLIWIREEFLKSRRDHGVVVVHGHTPARKPETKANRINVDTGAVYGGPLTCVVLEGTEYRFL
jgi:diadenosine tetraphosphatase ApaH/serine/threonine PP2A family protein phosphatase